MDNTNPLISFCLLTYNQEEYIEEAIKGALSQTYSPLEIIISDDCSTDNTYDRIIKITAKYKGPHQIIVNRNKRNLGLPNHVNKLFYKMAKGEFIAIAAGDDISLPERIKLSYNYFTKEKNLSFVSGALDHINNKGIPIYKKNKIFEKDKIYTYKNYIDSIKMNASGASRMYSAKFIKNFPPLNNNCQTEDSTWLLRGILYNKIGGIAQPLVKYRTHEKNISGINNYFSLKFGKIFRQYYDDIIFASNMGFITDTQKYTLLKIVLYKYYKNVKNKVFFHFRNSSIFKVLKTVKKSIIKCYNDLFYMFLQTRHKHMKLIDNFEIKWNRILNSIFKNIKVYWCTNDGLFNFGDELNPYIISRISKKKVINSKKLWRRIEFRKTYLAIGSILNIANKNTIVWGAGIIKSNEILRHSLYLAVRGPLSQKCLEENGITPPKTIGDPALLLPKIYNPQISNGKRKIGIIPHIVDYGDVSSSLKNSEFHIIDLTSGIESVINQILNCRIVISSSLHGIIVANAYNIPALWCSFSEKLSGDDSKFHDYFLSVGITTKIEKIHLNENLTHERIKQIITNKNSICPNQKIINSIQMNLLTVCPFA